jgi:hypothetical protein
MQITFDYPVYYRLEADVIDTPYYYEVTFNGTEADAYYDSFGLWGGSFPPHYYPDVPFQIGWETHVDQGYLLPGTYELSVYAVSCLHRYGIGLSSEGTAQLYAQLLGDADQDGLVGIDDLNIVLNHWDRRVPHGVTQFGDMNNDGWVGIDDLNAVLLGWGSDVRPAASGSPIPEPGTLAMVLGLVMPALRPRRIRSGSGRLV